MGTITWPRGCGKNDLVGHGCFGLVCLDPVDKTIVKTPLAASDKAAIDIERDIYQRFEERHGHPGILKYYGPCDSGLRLEFASNYGLRRYLQQYQRSINHQQRLRWCRQITDALAFVHSCGVIHGDLQLGNVFLDAEKNAKLGDFAGSSKDGSELLVEVTASHRYPGPLLSHKADIFALGSTLYEVITGQAPHNGCSDRQVQRLFEQSNFPDVDSLGLIGNVISCCWGGKFECADEVSQAIQSLDSPLPVPMSSTPKLPILLASTVALFLVLCVRRSYWRH